MYFHILSLSPSRAQMLTLCVCVCVCVYSCCRLFSDSELTMMMNKILSNSAGAAGAGAATAG
jgi:hypothetical protein